MRRCNFCLYNVRHHHHIPSGNHHSIILSEICSLFCARYSRILSRIIYIFSVNVMCIAGEYLEVHFPDKMKYISDYELLYAMSYIIYDYRL